MGCDMHLWVEEKTSKGWELVPAPKDYGRWYTGREYDLFGLLAGVRGGIAPILPAHAVENISISIRAFMRMEVDGRKTEDFHERTRDIPGFSRGIPEDGSRGYFDEVCASGTDGHTHSWFTLKELKAVQWDRHFEFAQFFLDTVFSPLEDYAVLHGRKDTDLRIVFFFDS